MLQNKDVHTSCFCYSDHRNSIVELKAFGSASVYRAEVHAQEIIFLLKGSLHLTEERKEQDCRLGEGQFVFMPSGSVLTLRLATGSELMVVRMTAEVPECHIFRVNKISEKSKYTGIYPLTANERMRGFVDGLLSAMRDGLKCSIYLGLEVSRMLFMLHAYYPHEECMRFFAPIASPDVKFSEFVRQNHVKYRTVGELALALKLSPEQFASRFRKVFGEAPREWLQREKAQTIYRDICRSDKPLKEIALEYDFHQSNFIRYCRKKFGASPGVIRSRLRNVERDRRPDAEHVHAGEQRPVAETQR